MKRVKDSIRKNQKSFGFALKGIRFLILKENNTRYHMIAGIGVVITGFYLKLNVIEWSILTSLIGLIFMAEAFNTAIEKLSDKVEPNQNEDIGLIKDISAGAVLIVSIATAVIGVLLIGSKLLMLLLPLINS